MSKRFCDLGVNDLLQKGLADLQISVPTDIQQKAIPIILGKTEDVVAIAKTGTGKTAAFCLPLLQLVDPKDSNVQALILVPTRELAQQVGEQFKLFAKYKPLNIMITYGGANVKTQKEELQNVDVLIGTPGRISDYLEQDLFLLGRVKCVVLDEVDAPLDDANVTRFCNLLEELTKTTNTKFIIVTHHALTMSKMDRLYGVTMPEKGISQLVAVDLQKAESMVA